MAMNSASMRLYVVLLASVPACSSCDSARAPAGDKHVAPSAAPVFVRGPSGGAAIAPFVAEEVKKAARPGAVLVYVGASWCEPCQYFHKAVTSGQLDTLLRGVRLIEFDSDADHSSLSAAGYGSKLIPLLAVPKPDGTASERRIEGSIKGPDAVQLNMVPRIAALLQQP